MTPIRLLEEVTREMHKLFMTTCDIGERRPVSAVDCENCARGKVLDNRSSVLCDGAMKFFVAPCFFEMRAAATVKDCRDCSFGEVSEDRLRVFCSRI